LGINLQSYEPEFVVMSDKKNLLQQLKQKINSNTQVYLAMDPDYEGERIAYELAKNLNIQNPIRITFNEITKDAILNAIHNPQRINQNHVDAQTCRRVLDRLIGYQLSPVLRNITGIQKASVGRCISVVTKMIKEKEEEIENHKFTYDYKCYGHFLIKQNLFKTILNKTFSNKGDLLKFLKQINHYQLSNVSEKQVKEGPPPPFITSSIQQVAYNSLGFSIKKITKVLQDMYQNGWITYIRTDSTNISQQFLQGIKHYLEQKQEKYKFRTFRNSSHAQQAHECIRPTDLYRSMQEMSPDEKRLYALIWKRTLASQMDDAIILKQTFQIQTNTKYYFKGEQEEILHLGWKSLYTQEQPKLKLLENPPIMKELICPQTYNAPPKRYSPALLIKKLEELGIGRPSTYSTIVSSIESKNYVYLGDRSTPELDQEIIVLDHQGNFKTKNEKIKFEDKKRFIITELGRKFTDILDREFPEIMDYQFTSMIENEMDQIANGNKNWKRVVAQVHSCFKDKLKNHQKDKIPRKNLGEYNNQPMEVLQTRYGPAIKVGDKFWNVSTTEITREQALQVIDQANQYPKSMGFHNNCEVKIFKGPYGEYFKFNGKNYGLKYVKKPVTLEACIKIINKKK
jgi:DNA topoisomerase-1